MTRRHIGLPLLLALFTCVFFAIRAWHGIWFLPFVDEAEHLLGGKVLDQGAILYGTFVSQHGPLTFMLTQAYGALFGWRDPNGARCISILLVLAAAACVGTAPVLKTIAARLWSAALFLGLVSTIWLIQALYMVNYHTIGGCFLVFGLAVFVVPLWRKEAPSRFASAAAGASFIFATATAYSFGPASVLLGASALLAAWLANALSAFAIFLAGAACALGACIVWMVIFGDILGYLAFHFAENTFFFSKFLTFSFDYFLLGLKPAARPEALVHSMALICCYASFLIFVAVDQAEFRSWRKGMLAPIVIGYAGLLSLCVRGGTLFQDGSFVLSSIAMLAMAFPLAFERLFLAGPAKLLPAAAGTLCIGLIIGGVELTERKALNSPWGFTRAQMVAKPPTYLGRSDTPLDVKIRSLTAPNDRILVVPYAPDILLSADRPPMERYIGYLPWEAAYAQAPWFGRPHDLCADMAKNPPKLVYFNDWIVWNHWSMRNYTPCFIDILKNHYDRQKDFPDLYVLTNWPAAGK